jgi:hypothetical protein
MILSRKEVEILDLFMLGQVFNFLALQLVILVQVAQQFFNLLPHLSTKVVALAVVERINYLSLSFTRNKSKSYYFLDFN